MLLVLKVSKISNQFSKSEGDDAKDEGKRNKMEKIMKFIYCIWQKSKSLCFMMKKFIERKNKSNKSNNRSFEKCLLIFYPLIDHLVALLLRFIKYMRYILLQLCNILLKRVVVSRSNQFTSTKLHYNYFFKRCKSKLYMMSVRMDSVEMASAIYKAQQKRNGRCYYNCSCYCCAKGCCVETPYFCWWCLRNIKNNCIQCWFQYFQSFSNFSQFYNLAYSLKNLKPSSSLVKENSTKKLNRIDRNMQSSSPFNPLLVLTINLNCIYCYINSVRNNIFNSNSKIMMNCYSAHQKAIHHPYNFILVTLQMAKNLHFYQTHSQVNRKYKWKQFDKSQIIDEKRKQSTQLSNCRENDQQLKINNLLKMFCNKRIIYRRKKRRRRRRCFDVLDQKNHHPMSHKQLINHNFDNTDKVLETLINSLNLSVKVKTCNTIIKAILKGSSTSTSSASPRLSGSSRALQAIITTTTTFIIESEVIKFYKRRKKTNLVWLFIGLVWFESPKIINTLNLSIASEMKVFKQNENITTEAQQFKLVAPPTSILAARVQSYNLSERNKRIKTTYSSFDALNFATKREYSSVNLKSAFEEPVVDQSDRLRLESIKRQILSRLGLTQKPLISHPLPKQFIWETIYRADGVNEFDLKNIHKKLYKDVQNKMQMPEVFSIFINNNNKYLTPTTTSNVSQNFFQNSIFLNKLLHSNNYLLDLSYNRGDPGTFQKRKFKDLTTKKDNRIYRKEYNQRLERNDLLGRTQEIIIFGQKGNSFKKAKLLEFPKQSLELFGKDFIIRKAELHLKIGNIVSRKQQKSDYPFHQNKTMKLWIFRMEINNGSKKHLDHSGRFCGFFKISKKIYGWHKFDLTNTVNEWKADGYQNKLKLLVDCTGCSEDHIIHLFEEPPMNKYSTTEHIEKKYKNLDEQSTMPLKNKYLFTNLFERNKSRTSNRFKKPKKNQSERLSKAISWGSTRAAKHNPSIEGINNQNTPFLVIQAELGRSRRVRRRAIDCSGAHQGQCCKESFYVSFKALGWDDWIIAPRGYFANYCRGDCTGPFRTPDTFDTFHSHFIEEYRKMGLLNGMKPCCAPTKFSSMSLIYYGDDGIIKRDLPKMVVDECGCP